MAMEKIPHHIESILDALVERGYAIVPGFLPQTIAEPLYQEASQIASPHWQTAAIGRAQSHAINTMVRNDKIIWLDDTSAYGEPFLNIMEQLRQAVNRSLFMGLFDYECHLAHYPKGAFYKKHLDAFKGKSNRKLTTVLYLNPEWSDTDGGQLVMYGKRGEVLETVLPKRGTLVVFLSDQFVHEVLPSQRDRFSLTGWFRLNSSISGIIDPPR
ncbi:SM-20-related protein [Idiomarina fontislapidosi]|nr:2OG-Fe(II) oxygenase [Idiomarina fontislapidosi]PYE31535.1 SM-20-related protein [Idiomarina fontislapidosi]